MFVQVGLGERAFFVPHYYTGVCEPAGRLVAGSDMFELVWICVSAKERGARAEMPARVCVCVSAVNTRSREAEWGPLLEGIIYFLGERKND